VATTAQMVSALNLDPTLLASMTPANLLAFYEQLLLQAGIDHKMMVSYNFNGHSRTIDIATLRATVEYYRTVVSAGSPVVSFGGFGPCASDQ
jgi:hypothetical protein